jgi:ATP synthase protein I
MTPAQLSIIRPLCEASPAAKATYKTVSGALVEIDKKDRIRVLRLVGFQILAVATLALAGLVVQWQMALSLLIGGVIGVAGSAWLALLAFRQSATRPAKEILAAFYIGEIGRFLIVTVLFALAFKQLALLADPRNALMLILAFIVSQVVIAIAPRLVSRAER